MQKALFLDLSVKPVDLRSPDERVPIVLYKKDSLGKWKIFGAGHELMLPQGFSTFWLGPSQERQLQFRLPCRENTPLRVGKVTFDNVVTVSLTRFLSQLPDVAGDYRIVQHLPGSATAEFKIVYPTVQMSRIVPLDVRTCRRNALQGSRWR